MTVNKRELCILGLATALSICFLLPSAYAGEPSVRGSIYDSNAQNLLGVTGATRTKVDKIMNESDARMQKVFDKYKINPKGEQHLVKVMEASSELKTIGS